MSSLDDVADKIEGMSDLDKIAKKIDSNAATIKDLLAKSKLTRQLDDLQEAMKHYKTAPIQSTLDIECVAKSCLNKGYKEISESVYRLAKELDDYSKARN